MPATRSARRSQNIATDPFTGDTVTSLVVSPPSPSKGHRTQPSRAAADASHRERSRAPSPATPDRILQRGGVTIQNDSGEDEMTEPCTPRPRSEGSSLGSSGSCGTPRKRKRSIGNGHVPTPEWLCKVRTVEVKTPTTLLSESQFRTELEGKDREIEKLKKELEGLRCAYDDLQTTKTVLAQEVHRLHQCTTEESELFADRNVKDGRGDSRGYQRMLKRIGQEEIPLFIPLPAHYTSGEIVDMPPVAVMGDRIEVDGLTIRFEEPIGAGGNGKVVGGTILNHNTKSGQIGTDSVAIKATMKSGVASCDAVLLREGLALQSLGERGIAPKLLAIVETPLRFLTIMERCPLSLDNLEDYIRRKNGGRRLDIDAIQILATRMTLLLDTLHETGQVHRDLKPDNILIKETGEMVLADFGSVDVVRRKYDSNLFGTVGFTAPYVKQQSKAEKNNVYLDMWSLGATILWMAGEDLNSGGPVTEEECKKVIESRFPIATQPLAHRFVAKCLAFPAPGRRRMTAKQALKHPWLTKVASSEIQDKLSLNIFRAAKSKERSLREKTAPYYLNIGTGPCRELKLLDG